jgi:hypothetical protein
MKKLLHTLALLVCFSSFGQDNREVNFGNTLIRLPKVIGLTECYREPIVKMNADLFKGTDDEEILGFYISDDEYNDLYNSLMEKGLQKEFVKIYSTNLVKNYNVSEEDFNKFSSGIRSMFNEYEGSQIQSKINSKMELFDISAGKPILLDEYQINSKIKSYVALMKFKFENENIISLIVMNVSIIKNKLIFIAYYDKYSNSDQIKKLKAKNDYFLLSLLAAN